MIATKTATHRLPTLESCPLAGQTHRRSWHGRAARRTALSFAGLLLPLILAQPQRASAQAARFALVCVGTETGYAINFSYRWGNSGRWSSTSVAPGKWQKLMWNYDYPGENRSPQLTIRYDDNNTRTTNMVRTDLKAYAASQSDCEGQGKTYNFYERGTEIYIQEED